MKLTRRDVRDVVVVEIHGKLLGAPADLDLFHEFIKELIDEGKNKIVISLRHTPLADSVGIGMLIGAYTSARKAGGGLVLAHVGTRIMNILRVTKLLLIFKTYDSVAEAAGLMSATADDGVASVPGVGISPGGVSRGLV